MARTPSKVEVVYYPKRAKLRRSQSADTVEMAAVSEDGKVARKPRHTLTDDEELEPTQQAFADLIRIGHEAFCAGRHADARTIFAALVALGSEDAFVHTMLGTIALAEGTSEQALEHFDAALELEPNDLSALVYRGEIRLSRKKYSRGMEDLERAVRLAPSTDPFVARAKKLIAWARANRPQ